MEANSKYRHKYVLERENPSRQPKSFQTQQFHKENKLHFSGRQFADFRRSAHWTPFAKSISFYVRCYSPPGRHLLNPSVFTWDASPYVDQMANSSRKLMDLANGVHMSTKWQILRAGWRVLLFGVVLTYYVPHAKTPNSKTSRCARRIYCLGLVFSDCCIFWCVCTLAATKW